MEALIYKFFLWLINPYFLFTSICIGYLLINPRTFSVLLSMSLASVFFVQYLKSIWQIPLPEESGIDGWAFPSGHTQGAALFYGWIALMIGRVWGYLLAGLIILSGGLALVYFHFHYPADIVGGVALAAIHLTLSWHAYHWFLKHNYPIAYLLLLITIFGSTAFLALPDSLHNLNILNTMFVLLLSFTFGHLVCYRWYPFAVHMRCSLKEAITLIVVVCLMFGGNHVTAPYTSYRIFTDILHPMILGLWLSLGKAVLMTFSGNKQEKPL